MKRSLVRMVARSLVGALFFAQMTVAAYACPGLSAALAAGMQMPVAGVSLGKAGDTSVSTPTAQRPNCDDMAGAMDPSSANLCAEHCRQGQQSDQAPTLTVPAAVLTALYATPLVPETAPPLRPAAATMSELVAASPPHAILHCVFRI